MPRSIPTTKHAWFLGGLATVPHRMQIMSVACQPPTCIGRDALGRQSGPHARPGHRRHTKQSNNTHSARGTPRPMSWQHRKQCASPNATHTTSVKARWGHTYWATCTKAPHMRKGRSNPNAAPKCQVSSPDMARLSSFANLLRQVRFFCHAKEVACLWGAGADFGRAPKQTQLGYMGQGNPRRKVIKGNQTNQDKWQVSLPESAVCIICKSFAPGGSFFQSFTPAPTRARASARHKPHPRTAPVPPQPRQAAQDHKVSSGFETASSAVV